MNQPRFTLLIAIFFLHHFIGATYSPKQSSLSSIQIDNMISIQEVTICIASICNSIHLYHHLVPPCPSILPLLMPHLVRLPNAPVVVPPLPPLVPSHLISIQVRSKLDFQPHHHPSALVVLSQTLLQQRRVKSTPAVIPSKLVHWFPTMWK